jgi:hypothetical protein
LNHRQLLAGLVVAVLLLLLGYSLVGKITGIYRIPAADVIGPVRSYLIWAEGRWTLMMLLADRQSAWISPQADRHISVSSGIWFRNVTTSGEPEIFQAYAPWDLWDVYVLYFTRDRLPTGVPPGSASGTP